MSNVFSCTTTRMIKAFLLMTLATTVASQTSSMCCDRRAPECQSRYSMCMTSQSAGTTNTLQCDSIFCGGTPYPLPTVCCDPTTADCQAKYQQCLVGTYGSTSLCSVVYCRSDVGSTPSSTRAPCCNPEFMRCETMTNICPESKCCNKLLNVCPPEAPICPTSDTGSTPFPSRSADPSSFPSRSVDPSTFPSRSVIPSMDPSKAPILPPESPFPSRPADPSSFPTRSPIPSQSSIPQRSMVPLPSPVMTPYPPILNNITDAFSNFTCCDPELMFCKLMYASCRESGSFMCDMIFCKPSPAPSRRPRPTPKFSPFPSPKIIRPIPSILPREFVSVAKFDKLNETEVAKIPKLKEIQVKLSCIFRTAVEKIKIRNVTIIKESGIRQVIKWNATEFDNADVPEVDCLAPARLLRGLQVTSSNIEVEYEVVDPPAEAFAMDVNSITAPTANAPSSTVPQPMAQPSPQPSIAAVAGGSIAGTLVVVAAVLAVMKYVDRRKRVSPLNTRQQRVRVSMNPLEIAARSTVGSSTRSAFNPQRSRV